MKKKENTIEGKVIDIKDLTVKVKGDSVEKAALKATYSSYYEQNPHRMDDELEKAQLLSQLNQL